jgi:hypothetical protein
MLEEKQAMCVCVLQRLYAAFSDHTYHQPSHQGLRPGQAWFDHIMSSPVSLETLVRRGYPAPGLVRGRLVVAVVDHRQHSECHIGASSPLGLSLGCGGSRTGLDTPGGRGQNY